MKTGPDGIHLLHYFESCRLKAYPDPATGGEPITIGWGNTAPWVKLGMTITQEEADRLFEERLGKEFEPGVMKAVWREPTQHQFDAMVSFAYNVGLGNFRSSTLLRKFNAGDDEGAAAQFLVWNKAAGKVMKGLQRRREAECRLFLGSSADAAIKYALAKFP